MHTIVCSSNISDSRIIKIDYINCFVHKCIKSSTNKNQISYKHVNLKMMADVVHINSRNASTPNLTNWLPPPM